MVKIFSAEWCGACKSLLRRLPEGCDKVEVVDISTVYGASEARKLSIKSLPSIVFEGKLITEQELFEKLKEEGSF